MKNSDREACTLVNFEKSPGKRVIVNGTRATTQVRWDLQSFTFSWILVLLHEPRCVPSWHRVYMLFFPSQMIHNKQLVWKQPFKYERHCYNPAILLKHELTKVKEITLNELNTMAALFSGKPTLHSSLSALGCWFLLVFQGLNAHHLSLGIIRHFTSFSSVKFILISVSNHSSATIALQWTTRLTACPIHKSHRIPITLAISKYSCLSTYHITFCINSPLS